MSELKVARPTSSGRRGFIYLSSDCSKNKPYKALTKGKKSTGGRNNSGRITSWHKGGGNKTRYRKVSFKRSILNSPAEVVSVEYDPNRNARIALIKHDSGEHEYVIAQEKLHVGSKIMHSDSIENISISPGNSFPLSEIPIGTSVCCVELKPGAGAKIARSAGTFITVYGKELGRVLLKMPSSEIRTVSDGCIATIGIVSNIQLKNTNLGKAGRNRWKGRRPHVRGECMNPVDHPLGGRTRGNRVPVSPWGQCAKGLKTRSKKKLTNKFIVSRRKKS